MDGCSDSGNAGSLCWPSIAPFKVSYYLRDYPGRLDARRLQAMPAPGDSGTVHDARHGANCDTRVGAWIKLWVYWDGCGAVLPHDNAPGLNMPFLRCTDEHDYIVCVAEIVAQNVGVSSGNLPDVSLNRVALTKRFDLFLVYSYFDYWV